jgi:hypothetical protein
MLHLVPVTEADESPEPYSEALARLASIRHALRLVDAFGGGPASDPSDDDQAAASWSEPTAARARWLDSQTERTAAVAAEGLEALLGEQAAGRKPNEAASRELAEEIRRGLEDVSRLMRDGA